MFPSGFRPTSTSTKQISSYSYGRNHSQARSVPVKLADEIAIMKREKQNLIHEKCLLKAKIVRLNSKAKRPYQQPQVSGIQLNSLEKEIRQVEQMTAAKRSEIALIKLSDRAAIIDELQEECLMLHMEIIRLSKQKSDAEKQRKETYKKLVSAQEEFSKDVLSNQMKEIACLKREIAVQKQRNAVIARKLQKKERSKGLPDERAKVMQTNIDSIDRAIRQEEYETKQIQNEIKAVTEEQTKLIKELEEKLESL